MNQPHQPESTSVSLDQLLCSSQSSGSQLEQVNATSQLSDSPEIHGMMLKYSDDHITDEEIRELNLQEAACQYMMQQDAQSQVTSLPFKQSQTSPKVPPTTDDHYLPDGQNTKLNQIAQSNQLNYQMESQGTDFKSLICRNSLAPTGTSCKMTLMNCMQSMMQFFHRSLPCLIKAF